MSYAPALSVLSTHKHCEGWLYNNFINIYGEYCADGSVPLRFEPEFAVMPENPFLDLYTMPLSIAMFSHQNILEYFMYALENNFYICTDYDEHYIKYTDNYLSNHWKHQIFIYGYNKKEKLFYTGEFYKNRHYSFEEVAFNQIEDSIMQYDSANKIKIWISLFELKDAQYNFDIQLLRTLINDYINSKASTISWSELDKCKKRKIVFGINNYDALINYLKQLIENSHIYRDIRPFHALYDHKVLMLSRIDYLENEISILVDTHIKNKLIRIKKYCFAIRNLFLKYLLTANNNCLIKIIEILKEMKHYEEEAMNLLLECLMKY